MFSFEADYRITGFISNPLFIVEGLALLES